MPNRTFLFVFFVILGVETLIAWTCGVQIFTTEGMCWFAALGTIAKFSTIAMHVHLKSAAINEMRQ